MLIPKRKTILKGDHDGEIIDTLVDCGITEEDFKNCGYGEYVKEYCAND